MTALAAHDVFYLYRSDAGDVAALRGLSLRLDDGEVVAALGPSGSGKTTFLALAAGFMRPSSGELTVLDERFDRVSERRAAAVRRHQIGIVRQHYYEALPHELTVEEVVTMPTLLLGQSMHARRTHISALLERAGLTDRVDARPSELSGGEQQRVALCAALAKQPRLILADEPTGELDAEARESVTDLLLELSADTGAAVLIVTHDTRVAERAHRTIHVRDGRLAAEGTDAPVLIVDREGWLRLPGSLREQANLGDRVRARASAGRIELLAQAAEVAPIPAAPTPARPTQTGRPGAAVALDGVVKRYGDEAQRRPVVDLSWSAEARRFHVIAGPSGSGKTTLLNLIAGLDRPDRGTVRVDETHVDRLGPDDSARFREQNVGYLSQHSTLVGYMSAAENVELALRLRGIEPGEASVRAHQWLAWVGLEKLADRSADCLSGGEQRRVALARALAPQPRLLLADEPTAQLDQFSGRNVIRLLQTAARDHGTTVIASSHDQDVIAAADAVLDLDPDVPRSGRPQVGSRAPAGWLREHDGAERNPRRSGKRIAAAAAVAALALAGTALVVTRPWSTGRSTDAVILAHLRTGIAAPTAKQVLYQDVTVSTRTPGAPALPTYRVRSWSQGGAGTRNFRALISRSRRTFEIGGTLGVETVNDFYEYRGHDTLVASDLLQPPIPSRSFDQLGIVRTALDSGVAKTATFVDRGATIRVRLRVSESSGETGVVTYVASATTYRPIEIEIPSRLLGGYADSSLGFGGFAALLTPQLAFATDPSATSPLFVYRYRTLDYRPASQRELDLASIRAQHPFAGIATG